MPGCKCLSFADCDVFSSRLRRAAVMWPSGLSSDVARGVFNLDWFLWECPGRQRGAHASMALPPQRLGIEAVIHKATAYSSINVSGKKRLKPALLFLNATRISTRFSGIHKDGWKSLRFPPVFFFFFFNGQLSSVANSLEAWMQFFGFRVFYPEQHNLQFVCIWTFSIRKRGVYSHC